jgi:mannose-1-phosphate guanylyltransferase
MSIEKDVFPNMARDGQLHATPLIGFWADVGQPKDFLTGTALYLESVRKKNPETLSTGVLFKGNVLVHPTATIGQGCKIGPNVVIGPNATIGSGVRLNNTVVLGGASVKDYAWVNESIIGWHSSVGRWTRIDATTVLGEDVHVKDEIFTNGATVLPHKVRRVNVERWYQYFVPSNCHVSNKMTALFRFPHKTLQHISHGSTKERVYCVYYNYSC